MSNTTIHYEPRTVQNMIYECNKAIQIIVKDERRKCKNLYRSMVTALSRNNKHVFWPWSKKVYSEKECEDLIQDVYYFQYSDIFRLSRAEWDFDNPEFITDFSFQISGYGNKIRLLFKEWNKSGLPNILNEMEKVGNSIILSNKHYNNVWKLLEMNNETFLSGEMIIVDQTTSDSLFWLINEAKKVVDICP